METKITITEVHVTKHVELKVETEGSININDMLSLEYADNTYYFRPLELHSTDKGTTAVLKERGYWARRLYRADRLHKNAVDYKKLIGLNMSVVTDKDLIKKIDIESTYC